MYDGCTCAGRGACEDCHLWQAAWDTGSVRVRVMGRRVAVAVMREGRVEEVLAKIPGPPFAPGSLWNDKCHFWRHTYGARSRGLTAACLFLNGHGWSEIGEDMGITARRARMIACADDAAVRHMVDFDRAGGFDAIAAVADG